MNRLIFADKIFECEIQGAIKHESDVDNHKITRDCYRFIPTAPYAEIVQYFVDNASYTWQYDTEIDGVPDVVNRDLSEYCKMWDIVIKPDGKYWVYMGKETTEEILAQTQTALDSAMVALGEVL